jgi:exosortase/archaeosortase family protein
VPPDAERKAPVVTSRARVARWIAAVLLLFAGGLLIALAGQWRGAEATISGHTIHLVTGQTAIAVPGRHLLILYRSASVQSIFVLTSECSVAYLVAAVLIGTAPLMLLRQLAPWRTALALTAAVTVLILVNVARLTTIGATVSTWGRDPGLAIAHTYLGSLLTVAGACAAGVAFAVTLVGRRSTRHAAAR